jgi:hypothetical protein
MEEQLKIEMEGYIEMAAYPEDQEKSPPSSFHERDLCHLCHESPVSF